MQTNICILALLIIDNTPGHPKALVEIYSEIHAFQHDVQSYSPWMKE